MYGMPNIGIPFSSSLLRETVTIVDIEKLRLPSPTPENISFLISCLDLTSLNATDTNERIAQLIEKAKSVGEEMVTGVAAVCIYQPFVALAVKELKNTKIGIATVAGGFPHGQQDTAVKCADIARSAEIGATEIDMVINRSFALTEDWKRLYEEVTQCKRAAGVAKLKVILATGELSKPQLVYNASMTSMMAGADFIKTSTGFEAVNATLEAGFVMCQAIKDYYQATGVKVGLKPAGGIRTAQQALGWLALVQQELGDEWLNPGLLRIGASSLLDDLLSSLKRM